MRLLIKQSEAEILRMVRNPYYLFWSLAMPILFYIIFTKLIQFDIPDQNQWNAHYLMSMTTFSVMGSSIMTMGIRMVQERMEGWTTFIRVTPLSGLVYFAAKMVGQTMVHLFSIIVIFLAGYLVNGVSLPASTWLLSGLWILLTAITFLALGTLVAQMKRVDTATGVSNMVYILLALTGGMWMPMEALPQVIQKVGMWLPAFHFGNGAWGLIRGDLPSLKSVAILAGYLLLFMSLSIYLRRREEVV